MRYLNSLLSGIGNLTFACALLLGFSESTSALTFHELPEINKVTAMATLAFRGRILEVGYADARVSEKQTIPYSNIKMKVGEAFVGVKSSTITLRQIGGRLPNHKTRFLIIPGLAELSVGEMVYIFANDRMQPFFATLYGDYSLYRIAQNENGRRLVLNAYWQPLQTDGKRIWSVPGSYCEPNTEDRSQCKTNQREVHDSSDNSDVVPRQGRPITPQMFDELIQRWRSETPQTDQPGQTVSMQEASFSAALRDFGKAVSAPVHPDDAKIVK